MTTYQDFHNIRRLEEITKQEGFTFGPSYNNYGDRKDQFGLWATEKLPIYNTDSMLVSGSAEELYYFIVGWRQQREFLTMLGLADTKKIERKVQDIHNKKLMKRIKDVGTEVEEE